MDDTGYNISTRTDSNISNRPVKEPHVVVIYYKGFRKGAGEGCSRREQAGGGGGAAPEDAPRAEAEARRPGRAGARGAAGPGGRQRGRFPQVGVILTESITLISNLHFLVHFGVSGAVLSVTYPGN